MKAGKVRCSWKQLGSQRNLTVTKRLRYERAFSGQVPIISGELGEDFTYSMATSEQTPSAIGLSVLIDPTIY